MTVTNCTHCNGLGDVKVGCCGAARCPVCEGTGERLIQLLKAIKSEPPGTQLWMNSAKLLHEHLNSGFYTQGENGKLANLLQSQLSRPVI